MASARGFPLSARPTTASSATAAAASALTARPSLASSLRPYSASSGAAATTSMAAAASHGAHAEDAAILSAEPTTAAAAPVTARPAYPSSRPSAVAASLRPYSSAGLRSSSTVSAAAAAAVVPPASGVGALADAISQVSLKDHTTTTTASHTVSHATMSREVFSTAPSTLALPPAVFAAGASVVPSSSAAPSSTATGFLSARRGGASTEREDDRHTVERMQQQLEARPAADTASASMLESLCQSIFGLVLVHCLLYHWYGRSFSVSLCRKRGSAAMGCSLG